MKPRSLLGMGAALLVGCSSTVPAAPATEHLPLWQVLATGAGDQDVTAITYDSAGNIVVAGAFWDSISLGGDTLRSAGGADIFVAKLDPHGRYLWSKAFGGPGDDFASGLALDVEDDLVLTGSFSTAIDFGSGGLESVGHTSIFLAKLAPSGAALWSKRFGDATFQSGIAVAVDPSTDDIDLAGDFVDTVDFGAGNLVSAGDSDVFLAQFDGAGNLRWNESFGDSDVQESRRLVVADGGIFLMGAMEGTVNFGGLDLVGGTSPHKALFAARFDADGQHVWSQMVMSLHPIDGHSHSAMEDSHSMAVDRDGQLHVAVSYSEGMIGGGQDFEAPAYSHLALVQFDPQGTPFGHRHYGVDPGLQIESGLAIDGAYNLELAGVFDGALSFGDDSLQSPSARAVFLTKFTADGQVDSFSFGDTDHLWVSRCMSLGAQGQVVVAGYSHPVDSDDRKLFLLQFSP